MPRTRKRDVIEVYRCTRAGKPAHGKKATHWRFRMVRSGEDEPMHWSDNVFDTAARAKEVAGLLNKTLFQGEYAVVTTSA